MAGKRKAEGIALLSLYNDDDDEADHEDEDETDDDDEQLEDAAATANADESAEDVERKIEEEGALLSERAVDVAYHVIQEQVIVQLVDLPQDMVSPPMASLAEERGTTYSPATFPPPQPPPAGPSGIGHGIFVDYEHDEATLSPEAEEGEIMSMGRAVLGIDIQVSNGIMHGVTPPSRVRILTPDGGLPGVLDRGALNQLDDSSQQLKGTMANDLAARQDEGSTVDVAATASSVLEAVSMEADDTKGPEADPLADFLPPPPTTKCSEELQLKFSKYLALKNAGRSFNETLRKSKGYRNPDFLQRAVKYQEIDQIGSCFRKEIFDPHGYDPSDFYDALAAELKREQERKEQAKKQSQRIEFAHGGVQPPAGTSTSVDKTKPILPALGGQSAVAVPTVNTSSSGSQAVPAACDVLLKAEGRSSKKSKWDKVDNDGKGVLPLPPAAKTNMVANASAHAALLTANAGAGYASFAQQKRKEAEERSKVVDKKLEKK